MAIDLPPGVFSREAYRLDVPTQDGYEAEKIRLRFIGVLEIESILPGKARVVHTSVYPLEPSGGFG